MNTGDTLRIAVGLFRRAFPTADVRGEHWMVPGTAVDLSGTRRTSEVPVWYRSDTWAGRLVGNRMDPHTKLEVQRYTVFRAASMEEVTAILVDGRENVPTLVRTLLAKVSGTSSR